jgi:hypothetical protein
MDAGTYPNAPRKDLPSLSIRTLQNFNISTYSI